MVLILLLSPIPQIIQTFKAETKQTELCIQNFQLKYTFFHANGCNLIGVSLNFVPKGPVDSISALVQVMACRQTGNKPS